MRSNHWVALICALLVGSATSIIAAEVLPTKAHGAAALIDPAAVARRVAIAGLPDGSSQVVVIDSEGATFHRLRRPDATWTEFAQLNGVGTDEAASAGAVAIAGMPDGSTQVMIDGDGGIYHRVRVGDGSWTEFRPLNGMGTTQQAEGSAVAVAGMPDGTAHVVIVGADGGVYHRVRTANGVWTEFQPLNGRGTTEVARASAVAITGLPDGSAQLVIAGTDGRVYHRARFADTTWTEFHPLNGIGTSDAATGSAVAIAGLPNGSSRVVVIGADESVYDRVRHADGNWTEFQGVSGSGTDAAAKGTAVSIAGMPDGTTQLVVAGVDNGVYHRDGSGRWTVLSEGFELTDGGDGASASPMDTDGASVLFPVYEASAGSEWRVQRSDGTRESFSKEMPDYGPIPACSGDRDDMIERHKPVLNLYRKPVDHWRMNPAITQILLRCGLEVDHSDSSGRTGSSTFGKGTRRNLAGSRCPSARAGKE